MNTPRPPTEPLDAQEREFARILAALPGGEPPPALDAKILRAAANAAAASRRPGARVLASAGALWGIGSAAAAVLALGVAWQLRYGDVPSVTSERAPHAQVVSEPVQDDSVSVDFGAQPAQAPAAAPPPPPLVADKEAPARLRRQAAATKPAAPAAAAPAAAPEPLALDQLDEHVAREAAAAAELKAESQSRDSASNRAEAAAGYAAKSAAANAAPAMQAAPAPAAPPPPASDAAAASAGRADTGATGALSSAVGGQVQERQEQAAAKKPATWLAEIRKLRDQGHIEEARARLVEFHKTYPKWVIPTDLAPLLSE